MKGANHEPTMDSRNRFTATNSIRWLALPLI